MRKLKHIACLLIALGTSRPACSMQRLSDLLHRGYAQSATFMNKTAAFIRTGAQKSVEMARPYALKVQELCQQHPKLLGSIGILACAIPATYALARSTKVHNMMHSLRLKAARQLLRAGYISTLPWALSHGTDINEQFEGGKTALHLAAGRGDAARVKNLIEHGALVNQFDNNLERPITYAAKNGYIAAIEQLIQSGAYINQALWQAAASGQLVTVKWLIQHGANHTQRCIGELNALDIAIIHHQTAVEHYLQSLRPAPQVFSNNSEDIRVHYTEVLHEGIGNKSVIQVKLAIKSGASLVHADESQSPLNCAITALSHDAEERTKLDEIAQVLVEAGAPLHNKDGQSKTPLLKAAAAGNLRLVELFVRHGAQATEEQKASYPILARLQTQPIAAL